MEEDGVRRRGPVGCTPQHAVLCRKAAVAY